MLAHIEKFSITHFVVFFTESVKKILNKNSNWTKFQMQLKESRTHFVIFTSSICKKNNKIESNEIKARHAGQNSDQMKSNQDTCQAFRKIGEQSEQQTSALRAMLTNATNTRDCFYGNVFRT